MENNLIQTENLEIKIEETKTIKIREKSLIDKELLNSNKGFTDCEIFD